MKFVGNIITSTCSDDIIVTSLEMTLSHIASTEKIRQCSVY